MNRNFVNAASLKQLPLKLTTKEKKEYKVNPQRK
jgi:hypothetical protein